MQKSKMMKKGAVAAVLVGCLALTGISAYFTDGDSATNNFVVGKISTDLIQPHWDAAAATKVTPLAEISNDPAIFNDGVNDAFVFLTVEIPYANVKTAELDGTVKAAADTQLFTFGHDGQEGVNDSWVEVPSARVTTYNEAGNADGTTVAAKVFEVVSKADPSLVKENEAANTDIVTGNEAGATSSVTQTGADEIK